MVADKLPIGISTKHELAQKIRANWEAILAWQAEKASIAPPPFYCSVDLRDAGFKIAPVDSNLFPAGFNNICPEDIRTAPDVLLPLLKTQGLVGKRVLVIPESHTSNSYYIENLYYLLQILENSGLEARVGWFPSLAQEPTPAELLSESGKKLIPHAMTIGADGMLTAGEFTPDWILLNNDFSVGYPTVLDAVKQPIIPTYRLGWHSRKKSAHFEHYNRLAAEFAQIADFDPWLIQVDTQEVTPVAFGEEQGIEESAAAVDALLERTRAQYLARGIAREPFAFVKNNAGTYGMGIMVVHSGQELLAMNRRAKNKMSVGKNKMRIESVAVQEGIPTATLVDRLAAEPVIYLMGCSLLGGFLRTNTERSAEENLNSQGMVFRRLCMSDLRAEISDPTDTESLPELELVYGSVALLSALATGLEMKTG